MKNRSLLIVLGLITLNAAAQAIDSAPAVRPPTYDKRGNLIVNEEQRAQDRQEGVIARGGYNPEVAAEEAAKQAWKNKIKDAPTLGNSSQRSDPKAASQRNIYRCKDKGKDVYADDDNKHKFQLCQLIRRAQPAPSPTNTAYDTRTMGASCSGAIIYKGSTYIFNDNEPCPIPDQVFQSRKPIEAEPTYYQPEK